MRRTAPIRHPRRPAIIREGLSRNLWAAKLITNCSNNYGPPPVSLRNSSLRCILNALSGKPLPIYGTGENIRDWLHVEDHCEAIAAVLEKGTPGECYNIGGRSERANIDCRCGAFAASLTNSAP